MNSFKLGFCLALAVGALATRPAHAGAPACDTVTISGVVYTFDTPYPVAGATVSIAEYPGISTTSDANGRYTLTVPDHADITPFVEMAGYRTMYQGTFETDGDDLANVHFQFVPLFVYNLLAGSLGIDPASPRCQVVSTVSVSAVRNLTFDEFVAYGPHGEAGATVEAKPDLGSPIYFNSDVLPDPSLDETSNDGGLLFPEVPVGSYQLIAHHPDHKFAKVKVTCETGRFINASPPWGLWEKK